MLLVDDHRSILESTAKMLAGDFDVVAAASDGWQALEKARDLAPDVIVLDVNMPGLDGFDTMRALARSGSRIPVVFLSMFDADEAISEAIRLGGRGYVLKPRMTRDLARAIEHVLLGRVFVPSPASWLATANDHGHGAYVYVEGEAFLDELVDFFDTALRRGDATCAVVTGEIRDGLDARLRARGWDVGPHANSRFLAVDVYAAMERLTRDGLPHAAIVAELVAELNRYRRTVTDNQNIRLTVFGMAAPMMYAHGNPEAAVALETAWSLVTDRLPFTTLCGYSTVCFERVPDRWARACAEHSFVSHGRA